MKRLWCTYVVPNIRRAIAMPAVWSARRSAPGPGPWVLTDQGVVLSFAEHEIDVEVPS